MVNPPIICFYTVYCVRVTAVVVRHQRGGGDGHHHTGAKFGSDTTRAGERSPRDALYIVVRSNMSEANVEIISMLVSKD